MSQDSKNVIVLSDHLAREYGACSGFAAGVEVSASVLAQRGYGDAAAELLLFFADEIVEEKVRRAQSEMRASP